MIVKTKFFKKRWEEKFNFGNAQFDKRVLNVTVFNKPDSMFITILLKGHCLRSHAYTVIIFLNDFLNAN